jgi:hypothetical protein
MRWEGVVTRLGELEKTSSGKSLRQDRHSADGRIILKWNLKEQLVDEDHMAPDMV